MCLYGAGYHVSGLLCGTVHSTHEWTAVGVERREGVVEEQVEVDCSSQLDFRLSGFQDCIVCYVV